VSELSQEHAAVRAAMFPATADIESMRSARTIHLSGRGPGGSSASRFESFFITVVLFTDFDPVWPIKTNWPYAIRGLRGSMRKSQIEFAELCGLGKATVERWEAGKTLPFRGDALQLLTLVRPHLHDPVQAGQTLNLAAAAVLPHITRPTAEYTGAHIVRLLSSGKHDHTDLARPLITALVDSRILVPIDPGGDELADTYFPLAGRLHQHNDLPPWAHQLIDDLAAASDSDRAFVLDLAKRLSR
jgi:transcriptional regulator with XRE-family HTH domain